MVPKFLYAVSAIVLLSLVVYVMLLRTEVRSLQDSVRQAEFNDVNVILQQASIIRLLSSDDSKDHKAKAARKYIVIAYERLTGYLSQNPAVAKQLQAELRMAEIDDALAERLGFSAEDKGKLLAFRAVIGRAKP